MPRPGRIPEKAKDFKGSIIRLLKELKKFKAIIGLSLALAIISSILTIISPDKISSLVDNISKGLIINTTNMEKISTVVRSSLTEEKIATIMMNPNLSDEDKGNFSSILSGDSSKVLSNTIANMLFNDITIDDITITSEDQGVFLSVLSKLKDKNDFYKLADQLPESVSEAIKPSIDYAKIKSITIFLLVVYILSSVFSLIQHISLTIVSNNFARNLRTKISKKINRLSLSYFDRNQNGDLLSRVTNDIDTIAQNMNNSIATLVGAIALFIGTLIMMFVTNYVMAFTAIGATLLGFIFMSMILSKSQKYFIARQKYLGALNGHIEEAYSGLMVIKTYNGRDKINEKFNELNGNVYEANMKSQFLSGLMPPLMGFVGNLGYVAVCLVGAVLTMNNTITFGVIVAFITYVRLFNQPLSQIAQALTSLQSVSAASERIFEFLDEAEMTNEDNLKSIKKNRVKGDIEFDNVTFTYEGNNKPTIKNFSASIKAGQKIAIVGPTGAGKTTMVNLLMKFYEISGGDIRIDGVSTKELTRESIHSLFTMVLQDTWLFDGTVLENIKYNRLNVSDEKVKKICDSIGLDHFIKTLPHGYKTILGDNDSISAGQKQLLTIARGMVEDAPFLILDEATSNVDTRTEELVQKAMDTLCEGKTSFIIAHRLSTIKNADLILVMKDGNIIESGNHKQLIKMNGFYADLYNSQFKL